MTPDQLKARFSNSNSNNTSVLVDVLPKLLDRIQKLEARVAELESYVNSERTLAQEASDR